jgi:hypothetical protein
MGSRILAHWIYTENSSEAAYIGKYIMKKEEFIWIIIRNVINLVV